jgi:hypothetical protein
MAIVVKTNDASGLLDNIIKAIEASKIETWSYKDGYFTHSPEQWRYKAWFKPQILSGELKFGIYPPKDKTISSSIYGVYHGRFIEMMLVHFDKEFSNIYATALIVAPDYVKK